MQHPKQALLGLAGLAMCWLVGLLPAARPTNQSRRRMFGVTTPLPSPLPLPALAPTLALPVFYPSCHCARAPGPPFLRAAGFSQGIIAHPTIMFNTSEAPWVPIVSFIDNYNETAPTAYASVYRLNTVGTALRWGRVGPLLSTPAGTTLVRMRLDWFGSPWVAFATGQGLTGAHAVRKGQAG